MISPNTHEGHGPLPLHCEAEEGTGQSTPLPFRAHLPGRERCASTSPSHAWGEGGNEWQTQCLPWGQTCRGNAPSGNGYRNSAFHNPPVVLPSPSQCLQLWVTFGIQTLMDDLWLFWEPLSVLFAATNERRQEETISRSLRSRERDRPTL